MRDRDFRLAQAQRHIGTERQRNKTREGALKRMDVERLRASEHRVEIERFYRGED